MRLATTIIFGLVRLALAGLCGWLVANGVISKDQVNEIYWGVTAGIVALGWALYSKYKDLLTLLVALAHPRGTTLAELEASIKNGATVDPTTRRTEVPELTNKGN